MNDSPDKRFSHDTDAVLMQRARALHEMACAQVDRRTRAHLATARATALAGRDRHPRRLIWLPAAGAMATCLLVIGALWLRPQFPAASSEQANAGHANAAMPMEADSRQLDLYQNLEFYQWLAQQPHAHARSRGDGQ